MKKATKMSAKERTAYFLKRWAKTLRILGEGPAKESK